MISVRSRVAAPKEKKMNSLIKAALSHYQAKEDEAIAILEVYFNDAVGIGEHSNIVKEVVEWTQKLTEARENIETLLKFEEEK